LGDKPDGVHPRLEKYLLRKAFDLPDNPYLPDDVLFRQKEQVCTLRPCQTRVDRACHEQHGDAKSYLLYTLMLI
jgi:hypothetical protein